MPRMRWRSNLISARGRQRKHGHFLIAFRAARCCDSPIVLLVKIKNAIISILVSIPIILSIGLFRQEYELQFDMYVTEMRTGLHVEIFSESGMYF